MRSSRIFLRNFSRKFVLFVKFPVDFQWKDNKPGQTKNVLDENLNTIVSIGNISKPFFTNLPCLCPEKADVTLFVSLKTCKLKWSVCQPVFIE